MSSDGPVSLYVDTTGFLRGMSVADKQVKFAASKALIQLQNASVEKLRDELGDHFRLRGNKANSWPKKGIRAGKTSKYSLKVEVGSRDEFMQRQATGGVKKPRPGSRAIVVSPPGGARRSPTTMLGPRWWPKALLKREKGNPFFFAPIGPLGAVARRKPGRKGIEEWEIGKRVKGERPRLKIMYFFHATVRVPRRWPFQRTVESVVGDGWPEAFAEAYAYAIATAIRDEKGRMKIDGSIVK